MNIAFNKNKINTEAMVSKKNSEPIQSSKVQADFLRKIRTQIQSNGQSSEEKKEEMLEKITRKIKAGKKLTAKEMDFLRQYAPELYQQMVLVQRVRESVKNQLKHCKTKEQAQRVIAQSMAAIGDKNPAKEALQSAIQNVAKQFVHSQQYQKLPDTEQQLKQQKKKTSGKTEKNPFPEDEPDEIIYTVDGEGYQTAVVCTSAQINSFSSAG